MRCEGQLGLLQIIQFILREKKKEREKGKGRGRERNCEKERVGDREGNEE